MDYIQLLDDGQKHLGKKTPINIVCIWLEDGGVRYSYTHGIYETWMLIKHCDRMFFVFGELD